MAGYGIKSFLIAQSLNQIERAYGQNNSILDNCHVRVSFATNDERTAKRVSDALGTATELRAQRNYAGSRLSPWLGHLMVSRQESARPLLTPGEIMQLPPGDELVLVSGLHPIRAKKARYYEDRQLKARVLAPPTSKPSRGDREQGNVSDDDWTTLPLLGVRAASLAASQAIETVDDEDPPNSGIRREPELGDHEEVLLPPPAPTREFEFGDAGLKDEVAMKARMLQRQFGSVARQGTLDPGDGMAL